jgi:hypothetical protein
MKHMFYNIDYRIVANKNDMFEMEGLSWQRKK